MSTHPNATVTNTPGFSCCPPPCSPVAGPDRDGLLPFVVTYHYNRPCPQVVWAVDVFDALATANWRADACARLATVVDMADHAVALAEDDDRDVSFRLVGVR